MDTNNRSNSWSVDEVVEAVRLYILFLSAELEGKRINKRKHLDAIVPRLNGRSRSSLEMKLSNVAFVFAELGLPVVSGYQPLRNTQRIVFDIVRSFQREIAALERYAVIGLESYSSDSLFADLSGRDWTSAFVQIPRDQFTNRTEPHPDIPTFSDFLEMERRKRQIGTDGEMIALMAERQRLMKAHRPDLAEAVEHVAVTQGDGLGFDIASFNDDGTSRIIEVKTTTLGVFAPFIISANELRVSRDRPNEFYVYRVYDLRTNPKIYTAKGAVEDSFRLQPLSYKAYL